MLALDSARRLVSFYRRHGFRATVGRILVAWRRWTHLGRMFLYACPLPIARPSPPTGVTVERVDGHSISKEDYQRMVDAWNPTIRAHQLADRFAAGSELWLAKVDGRMAGFGWTVRGRTIEPHFFPLQADDVHLFDFLVFPDFRGRGINVALVMEILSRLGGERIRCAHIECATWNHPQVRSLAKTPFRPYAVAAKFTVFGRPIVFWGKTPVRQAS